MKRMIRSSVDAYDIRKNFPNLTPEPVKSPYADLPADLQAELRSYDPWQRKQIAEGYRHEINYRSYMDPDMSYKEMEARRIQLETAAQEEFESRYSD